MNKLLSTLSLLVTAGALSTLAGCELYFGDHGHNNNDTWTYCGSDGLYQCQGDSCEWVSSTCSGTGSGTGQGSGGGSGYECTSNTDCAAGCYCSSGTCTEGGFCSTDADCGSGYHCDTQRSSCEPNTPPPANTCDYDNQCAQGQYCAPDHTCQATCTCTNDTQAQQQGYGWCDETRNTCLPGQDPAGSCGGAITCTTAMPSCPSGQIAVSIDGCWTGACRDIAACDVPASCTRINDETDCTTRTDCGPVYGGTNCHTTNGSSCTTPGANCTCDSYFFASCAAK